MRFENLALERYGAFCDRTLTFRADAHVHVVHGLNEAGKTSALAAIGDLLFGFGHTTPYDFLHETKVLRVGATVRRPDGSLLSVRRRKGRDNTLVDAQDRPLPDDVLAPLLGGVTRHVFLSEFGLTAQALRDGGRDLLRAGGRLAETLAASSAGLADLMRARAAVESEADALFAPRRSASKAFYVTSERHEAAGRRLREAIVTTDAWAAANAAARDAAEDAERAKRELETLQHELRKLERTRRTRPRLAAIDAVRVRLAGFADLAEASAEAIAGWQAALAEDARLAEKLGEVDAADAAATARSAAVAVDPELLAAGPAVDALRERIGAVAKASEDLPRRLEARRGALDELAAAARRLGLASPDELLRQLPTDAATARVRALIGAGRRAAERVAEARQDLEQRRRERDELAREAGPAVPDPAPLRRRLLAFADVPADADIRRRLGAAIDRETRRLAEDAAALDPAVGSLDELAARPLPDAETIARAERQSVALAADVRQCEDEVAAAGERHAKAQREIARLAAKGAVTTHAELMDARQRRDAALAALGEVLDDQAAARARQPRYELARSAIGAADAAADQLLAHADRAARREAFDAQLAEAAIDRLKWETRRDRAMADQARAEAEWRALWAKAGLAPLDPPRMVRWRARVDELLAARERLAERCAELAALSAKLDDSRAALSELAREAGADLRGNEPLEALHRAVADAVAASEAMWSQARAREVERRNADRLVARAEDRLAKAAEEHTAWRTAWPAALAAIGQPATSDFAEAEAVLAVWQGVPTHRTTLDRESRSVEGIERDLDAFACDVGMLRMRLAPDVAEHEPRAALSMLGERLERARAAQTELEHLGREANERQAKRTPLAARRASLSVQLGEARRQLGMPAEAAVGPVADRLAERLALRRELDARVAELAELGDGLGETALRAEQADIDLVGLDGAIEDRQRRLAGISDTIGAAASRRDQAEAAVAALAAGRGAEDAAQARSDAAAELRDISERWLVRAAAARLAGLAVERHRAAVQDPLIARASTLFATVTSGAFSGLATDYDKSDVPVLVGRRADGRLVPVDGLSEGTRDQLFLVLRLALLEGRSAAPLPFIGDDLLASFDEPRTAQALDALAAFGRTTQVIVFTHHAHVASIARDRLNDRAEILTL